MIINIRQSKNALIGLNDMCDFIGLNDTHTILEIGSYAGQSAQVFAKRCKTLICIDPWMNNYDDLDAASYQHPMSEVERNFDENVKSFNNVKKVKAKAEDIVNFFDDNSIDVVYIDGVHLYENVKEDIELWLPKVKKGGFLTGHDYQGRFPGTIKAVDEMLGCLPDKTFRDTSWCKRIK